MTTMVARCHDLGYTSLLADWYYELERDLLHFYPWREKLDLLSSQDRSFITPRRHCLRAYVRWLMYLRLCVNAMNMSVFVCLLTSSLALVAFPFR